MAGEKSVLQSAEAPLGPLVIAFAEALGVGANTLEPAAREFAAQAQDDWSADELPDLDAADVARALADFWRFGESAKDLSQPAIRLRRSTSSFACFSASATICCASTSACETILAACSALSA